MTTRRPSLLPSIFAVVALGLAGPALSQSYGLGDQVLTIGATEFRPNYGSNNTYFYGSDGYLYGSGIFIAPLRLPDGAEVFGVCLDSYLPVSDLMIQGLLAAIKLPAAGQDPGNYEIPGGAFVAPLDVGYNSNCNSAALSYTFHDVGNVDGLGDRRLAHRVFVNMDGSTGLGAVRILWRRHVSPSPGSATFGDVPTSDPAFQFVEALVASGVTAGCGGGNYCPDATLTRRQMAVFLSKALGLHWAQ